MSGERGMMPWRDQVRLAWKAIRWVYWISGIPIWANITIWIVSAAAIVSVLSGNLWGFAACLAVCIAIGIVTWRREQR